MGALMLLSTYGLGSTRELLVDLTYAFGQSE
jgi:hypothetical protein